MIRLQGYGIELLSDDGRTSLFRCCPDHAGETFLIRCTNQTGHAGDPLTHEMQMAPHLGPEWAVQPIALSDIDGRPVLRLSDPGGMAFDKVIDKPVDLQKFLSIAINIAGALRQFHARGLVHKDLKPANILVATDLSVRLTGFGAAARLRPERHRETRRAADASPEPASGGAEVSGTWEYMAPEQTGRMTRSVDRRSDFYALGVSLYQALAGRLPFEAEDPAEWVLCHMAREPRAFSPQDGVPDGLAAVVMKLLSKPPEDRYQTARALELDLIQCLGDWQQSGAIGPFKLARHDRADLPTPPGMLYGRAGPIGTLEDELRRASDKGRMVMVLVSGTSGIGKSSLVHELRRRVEAEGGLFTAGKFDQHREGMAYATGGQAVRGLIAQLLELGPKARDIWRSAFQEALGENVVLLAEMIPEFARLMGPCPAIAELAPAESMNRFDHTFRQFLRVLSRKGRPLCLFIDDMQWIDKATLGLITRLISAGGVPHLMLIGAFRDNEIGPGHPMLGLVAAARRQVADLDTREIQLGPLSREEVTALIADTLARPMAEVVELAAYVHHQSNGNPLFTTQMLTALAESGALRLDSGQERWDWDMPAILLRQPVSSVTELMAARLERLEPTTQYVIARLACLGSIAHKSTLSLACGLDLSTVEDALWYAVQEGMLSQTGRGYAFVHDRVREASYALIPNDARPVTHLQIARRLTAELQGAPSDDLIIEAVSAYDKAAALLTDPQERHRVAELHLAAGRLAKDSGAQGAACDLLAGGLRLLGAERWTTCHQLSFDLDFTLAECALANGDFAQAEASLLSLQVQAISVPARAAVTSLLVTLYTASDRSDRAIETCLLFLQGFGFDWVPNPSPDLPRAEYARLCELRGSRSVPSLIDLPLMTDEDSLAIMDVLAAALPPAFFSDEHLVSLILCRMANISLLHGVSEASSLGFAYLGMVGGSYFGEYQVAYSYGRLGFDLADRHGFRRYRARVLMTFAYHVSPWTNDIREERPLLVEAFEDAKQSGDLTYAGFSSVTLVTSMLAVGDRLDKTQRTAETRLAFVRQARFGLCVDIHTTQLQLVRTLRGLNNDLATLNSPEFSETDFENHLAKNPSLDIAACWYWIRKLQSRFLAGRIEEAGHAADRAEALIWTSGGHFEIAEYHFHAALARLALPVPPMKKIVGHLTQLQILAGNCPANFEARLLLVSAEVARVRGEADGAMRGYDAAIRAAQASNLPQIEAMAHELGAAFYASRAADTVEIAYLRQARSCYESWGATGKVRQLDQLHPMLMQRLGAPVGGRAQSDPGLSSVLFGSLHEVSGMASLADTISALLRVVLEQAAASRAVLILSHGERLKIEAEAALSADGFSVRMVGEPVDAATLPQTILHATIRERDAIVVEDTQSESVSADPYFSNTAARSALCIPLEHRAKTVGLLYLENDHLRDAFPPDRISSLRLIAAQTALTMENATLEEKEALLKEVHHRVKNNLQLITSLLNLQACRIDDPQVARLFADSRDRVRSMALVHENLYQLGNFARVPMRTHLEAVAWHLFRAHSQQDGRIKLVMLVDDIQLDLDRAIPCGLIVNELVSNALKHAFPGDGEGIVTVRLELQDRLCRLTVSDNGIGTPATVNIETANTLGLQLVGDLAAQLKGRLIQVEQTEGTGFSVVLQLPKVDAKW